MLIVKPLLKGAAAYRLILKYEVKYSSNNHYPRNILIPVKRKKILFKNGYKNIFSDQEIFWKFQCSICTDEFGERRTKNNKSVQYWALHLVGNLHKIQSPINKIIENLQTLEYYSLTEQDFNWNLLRGKEFV